jgi:cytochrome c oxidase cbb3-type subunit III
MHTVRARTISAQGKSVVASLTRMAVVACSLTVFSATGCNRSGSDTVQEPSQIEALAIRDVPANAVAESQLRGGKVYKHYCAICHGYEGQGNGFNSTNLAVPPRDFSNPQFWREATDEHLLLTVSKGGTAVGKSVLMPAWGRTLTDRQTRDVVAFLHTLAQSGEPKDNGSGPSK